MKEGDGAAAISPAVTFCDGRARIDLTHPDARGLAQLLVQIAERVAREKQVQEARHGHVGVR